jgi:hypothetical protein
MNVFFKKLLINILDYNPEQILSSDEDDYQYKQCFQRPPRSRRHPRMRPRKPPKISQRASNLMNEFDLTNEEVSVLDNPEQQLRDLKFLNVNPGQLDYSFKRLFDKLLCELRRRDKDKSLKRAFQILNCRKQNLDIFIRRNKAKLSPFVFSVLNFLNDYLKLFLNLKSRPKYNPMYSSIGDDDQPKSKLIFF